MKLTIYLIAINFLLLGFISFLYFSSSAQPIADPQSQVAGIYTPKPIAGNYIKFGFLPYWNLNKVNFEQLNTLTHVAYFGVAVSEKGEIQTHLNDQTYELGHHRIDHPTVTQIIDNPNLQSVLVIRAFSEGSITQALNPNKRQDLINELIQTAQENKFSGFNIDFEPPGDMSNFSSGLTEFTRELSDACRWQIPNCHMSIDVYASTPFNSRIWELRNLANHVDHIIIMGYDFYYSGSPNAGPPAPIYGSPDRWKYDLQNSINAFITQVPPKQLILGVPWYGYEWTTLSQTPGSVALGKGGTATYSRVQELLTQCPSLNCKINTDPDSLTPYIIYHKDGDSIQQIWYDDRLSLSYKYQLVRDWSLAGMAIWALGYEYPYTGLWEQLQTDLP